MKGMSEIVRKSVSILWHSALALVIGLIMGRELALKEVQNAATVDCAAIVDENGDQDLIGPTTSP
jgi:hypothetical protein